MRLLYSGRLKLDSLVTTDETVTSWTGVLDVLQSVDQARDIRTQAAAACFTNTDTKQRNCWWR